MAPKRLPDELLIQISHFPLGTAWNAKSSPCRQIISNFCDEFLRPIVESLKRGCDAADNNHKPQWASTVSTVLTRPQMIALGFKISKQSFTSARRHAANQGRGAPPAAPVLPAEKQPINEKDLKAVREFLELHSQPASHHTVMVNGVSEAVQYLDRTVSELPRLWIEDSEHRRLSATAFRKAQRSFKVFKTNKQRSTDMCENCLTGERVESAVKRTLALHANDCVGRVWVEDGMRQCSKKSSVAPATIVEDSALRMQRCETQTLECSCRRQPFPTDVNESLKSMFFYYHHHALKDESRTAYRTVIEDCAATEAIVTVDFKQNININCGPSHRSGGERDGEGEREREREGCCLSITGFICDLHVAVVYYKVKHDRQGRGRGRHESYNRQDVLYSYSSSRCLATM